MMPSKHGDLRGAVVLAVVLTLAVTVGASVVSTAAPNSATVSNASPVTGTDSAEPNTTGIDVGTTDPSDNNTTDSVDNASGTVDNTIDTVDNTTDTEDNTTDTIDNTTDTVDNTTDAEDDTTDTVNDTTDTIDNTTGSEDNTSVENTTAGALTETGETLDGVTGTGDDLGLDEVVGPVESVTATVVETSESILDGVSDTKQRTVALVSSRSTTTVTDGDDEHRSESTSATVRPSGPTLERQTGSGSGALGTRDAGEGGPPTNGTTPATAGAVLVISTTPILIHRLVGSVVTLASASQTLLLFQRPTSIAALDWRDRLWRVFTRFRYSRYDESDPLDHDVRATLYEHVEATPGVYLSALSERADVPLSTARYHLRILESEGLVESWKSDGRRRFGPVTVDAEPVRALDPSTAAVLATLERQEPATGAEIAANLEVDASTASHHLQKLESVGFVDRRRDGRTVRNRLTAEGRTALSAHREPAVEAP